MRKVVFVVATRYSPQKVRVEDGGERQRTSNRPVSIAAKPEPERISLSSPEDNQDPEVREPRLVLDKNPEVCEPSQEPDEADLEEEV